MGIPDFQSIMRPLLRVLADGQEHPVRSLRDTLAQQFALSPQELEERLPSGRDLTYRNRVGWSLTHLKGAALIESPRRGVYRITDRGQTVLSETLSDERVDLRTLAAFDEYRRFRAHDDDAEPATTAKGPAEIDARTPTERIEAASRELRGALVADLLERIGEQPPDFFEQVVLDVLRAIGYGGTREDAAERLGRSGDGGVDGVIREDRLGLDLIYVQAKRWSNVVGRPAIQQFVGALNGQRATKGVFITTSSFSREAHDYAEAVNPRVILVDGQQLAELMIEHNVGVTVEATYRIRRVDLDYFDVEDSPAPPSETKPPESSMPG
jgi:restriction system protein